MECTNPEVSGLTNYEVLEIMKKNSKKDRGGGKNKKTLHELFCIEKKVNEFLDKNVVVKYGSIENVKNSLIFLKQYNFSTTEVLDIINNLPSSEVELSVMLEDYETVNDDVKNTIISHFQEIIGEEEEVEGEEGDEGYGEGYGEEGEGYGEEYEEGGEYEEEQLEEVTEAEALRLEIQNQNNEEMEDD
eukprot:TRINITY_DN184_c0_g6_i1.p1 TRINITY_DN184_c0_g6~~TRINITY_DN184_c0_g6_i1.p1  ORF type:complete len:188 (+),score=86.02 TRINITY_DN184_c0_g6_i1:131-694(+)